MSHDRTLLNLLPYTCELDRSKITLYGGNYDFYKEQKEIALAALQNQLSEKEKELKDKVDYKSKNAFRYYEKHPDARKVDFEEI